MGRKAGPAPPPPAVARPAPAAVQLRLFDQLGARVYHWGRVDLRSGPPPANPWLAWGLHVAHALGEAHGFGAGLQRGVNRILVMLLADYSGADPIRLSGFSSLVRAHHHGAATAIEVLEEMGVLEDDRPPTFETWLDRTLAALPAGMREEVRRWAIDLRYGTPRGRPRPGAARSYPRAVLPVLLQWSACHGHLREVTRDEVLAHVRQLRGRQRQMTVVGLRSLFAWAKRHRVVFANPTVGIAVGKVAEPVWQPLSPEEIAQVLGAATTPRDRVVVALAAVHAARAGAIRALTLDDVDVANRRITIAGHTRPLDDLTCRLVVEWLDRRRRNWPDTANPHLLVSRMSAVGLKPVSYPAIASNLRGLAATLDRLRIDRQLEEALTHRADPLHLAAVFGIADSTAVRYANSARQLLEAPANGGD